MNLHDLARTSISRQEIIAQGYLSLCAHADLHPYGYSVRTWFRLKDRSTIYEYNPRLSKLPRITAHTYQRQAAVHLALSLNLVPQGETWVDLGQRGLFDDLFVKEAS